MINRQLTAALFGATVGLATGVGVAFAGNLHPGTHPVPGVIKQVVASFDNPEGAIFSLDGNHVFISNAAEIGSDRADGFGWGEGEGYISKLEVTDSGELKMVEEKLISGLTAPVGMGVIPVSTGKFPRGTIFACAGASLLRDSATGKMVKDRSRHKPKLIAFNESGDVLGEIDLGPGSIFDQINGAPVALPNALGFDRDGNLYFTDTMLGHDQFDPPFEARGGLWKIPVTALDTLADGGSPADKPSFIAIPGLPDGVEVSPIDGKIYVNTVGPVAGVADPADGGIYALTDADIASGHLPAPFDEDLGALDGLDFTDAGVMLNTQIRGDIPARLTVSCPGRKATTLALAPGGSSSDLSGPADIAIRSLAGGNYLVVIPELTARDATPGDDEVTVVALPSAFEQACR